MKREELLKSINEKECHVWEVVHELVKRAIDKDEEILAKHLEKDLIQIEKPPVSDVSYDYYILTRHNLIRIFAFLHKNHPDSRYSYGLCPLNRFMGLEEKYLPESGLIAEMEFPGKHALSNKFPTKFQVKIYFAVRDENFCEINLTPERVIQKTEIEGKEEEIKEFVSALKTSIREINKNTHKEKEEK